MEIDILFRIAAIGILITVISQILNRAGREDIATLATLSGLVVVLVMVIDMISELFSSLRSMFSL
ncbi:MAG: stage III sporulation protein AC [Christensenellales bacterium]|nr:stage III sporulation protein AC [Christensenellales bacterium]